MTETFKKLNYKAQSPILVLGAPESFKGELEAMAGEARVELKPGKGSAYGFALAFDSTREGMFAAARKLLPHIEEGAVLWFAYPKGSSKKLASEINRDSLWELLAPLGLKPVRQIAIDEDWSALRFKPE